jgi:hypothetical protein
MDQHLRCRTEHARLEAEVSRLRRELADMRRERDAYQEMMIGSHNPFRQPTKTPAEIDAARREMDAPDKVSFKQSGVYRVPGLKLGA